MSNRQTTAKPRYRIEQIRLDDEDGIRMWDLDNFAAEFGHEVHRVFPIFLVLVDGELSAYYYAQPQVCIYPAVHPAKFTRRALYEVSKVVVSASKQVFGNPLWLIEQGSPAELPAMLRKVYLYRTPLRVYEVPEHL
jgi:hypothetical protein